jgi:putative Mg2+ transporter-C (MgtC) family protein
MLESVSWQELIVRLAIAAAAGMAIGLEREWREKSAGFRTITLVSTGSAIFVLAAVASAPAETVRMMTGIATGIGFLGAGSILQSRGTVSGLTTAATVWMASALGVTAALGEFTLTVAGLLSTLIVLTALSLVPFGSIQRETRTYQVDYPRSIPIDRALSCSPISDTGLSVTFWSVRVEEERVSTLWLAYGTHDVHMRALELLSAEDEILTFSAEQR